MRVCLQDEKYQHFFDGYPSTNGLSGKWISEICIYNSEAPPGPSTSAATETESTTSSHSVSWPSIVLGVGGGVLMGLAAYFVVKRRRTAEEEKDSA